MIRSLAVVVALSACGAAWGGPESWGGNTSRREGRASLLVDPPPAGAGRVMTHGHGSGDVPWIAGAHTRRSAVAVREAPGSPGAYGAEGSAAGARIRVRAHAQTTALNPWTPIEGRGINRHLETARLRWLRERGLTERVRTHSASTRVPDATTLRAAEHSRPHDPTPAIIIRVGPSDAGERRIPTASVTPMI